MKAQQRIENYKNELRKELEILKAKEADRWDYDVRERIEKIETELLPNDKKFFTEFLYTDAHAYEVIEQKTENCYVVRQFNVELTAEAKKDLMESFEPGGFCGHFDNGCQEWIYTSNENNPLITIRRHKNGKFYRSNTNTCPFVMMNEPYEHYDYNF